MSSHDLSQRIAEVQKRETAVQRAQEALLRAEEMLRSVTDTALKERQHSEEASKQAMSRADEIYKDEVAAREAADQVSTGSACP